MTTSKTIAALLGPTFVATAVMVLVNLDAMPTIIEELSKSPMLIVLAGYAAFVPQGSPWCCDRFQHISTVRCSLGRRVVGQFDCSGVDRRGMRHPIVPYWLHEKRSDKSTDGALRNQRRFRLVRSCFMAERTRTTCAWLSIFS